MARKPDDSVQYRRAIFDMFLNIVANAIPILVLQLVILPLLARRMLEEDYGFLVTILAVLNTVPASFGNVLNNIRLLYDKEYSSRENDFSFILFTFEVVSACLVVLSYIYYASAIHASDIILLLAISLLWLAKEYYIVCFRLNINYKAILISNLITVVGYITGYLCYLLTDQWQWIYIFGNALPLVYIYFKSNIIKEPFARTHRFSYIYKQSIILLISGVLLKLMTYADKFIIYPILGGATVSVYYVSTLSGKIVSLLVGPVAGVMLSYLTKIKKNDKLFYITLALGTIACVLGYGFGVLVSKPVLRIIYPTLADRALVYIYVTTGTAVTSALYSLLNPFIMEYFDLKYQIIVNSITILMYVLLSLLMLHFWGLMGFCIGTLITNVIRVVFVIFIYTRMNVKA